MSAVTQVEAFGHQGPSRRKVVLMIDDAPDILDVNRLLLEMEGLVVYTARGSKDALSMLARIERPNLILVDLDLDDDSGLVFIENLERNHPEIFANVPVVLLTGMSDVATSSADGIISKAIGNRILVARVLEFISLGKAQNSL